MMGKYKVIIKHIAVLLITTNFILASSSGSYDCMSDCIDYDDVMIACYYDLYDVNCILALCSFANTNLNVGPDSESCWDDCDYYENPELNGLFNYCIFDDECDASDDLGCGCYEPGPSGCDNTCGSNLEEDCSGVCGGELVNDICGVCNGDNSTCTGDLNENPLEGHCETEISINGQNYCSNDYQFIENILNNSIEIYGPNFHRLNASKDINGDGVIEPLEFYSSQQEWNPLNNRLESWACNDCYISGEIPQGIDDLTSLLSLSLSNNAIYGTIPSPLLNLPQLSYLDLSYNLLSGSNEFCNSNIENYNVDNNYICELTPGSVCPSQFNSQICIPEIVIISPLDNQLLFKNDVSIYFRALNYEISDTNDGIDGHIHCYVDGSNQADIMHYSLDPILLHGEDALVSGNHIINLTLVEDNHMAQSDGIHTSVTFDIFRPEPPIITGPESNSSLSPDNIILSWDGINVSELNLDLQNNLYYDISFRHGECGEECDPNDNPWFLDHVTSNPLSINTELLNDGDFFRFDQDIEWFIRTVYDDNEGYKIESDWTSDSFTTMSLGEVRVEYLQQDIDDNQWQLIGLPFYSDLIIPGSDIFGSTQTYNQNSEPTNWVIYDYNSQEQKFELTDQVSMSNKSYMLYTTNFVNMTDMENYFNNNEDNIIPNVYDFFEIQLDEGWNLLSWPSTFEDHPDFIINSDLISDFWFFDGGAWQKRDPLHFRPFDGFAIYNKTDDKINIGESIIGFDSETSRINKNLHIDWGLNFSVQSEDGESKDSYNYIGLSSQVRDGIDSSDEMNPPFMGKGVDISFIEDGNKLAVSNKNSLDKYKIWKLKLNNETNGSVLLKWTETVQNDAYSAYMYILGNDTYIDLLQDTDAVGLGFSPEGVVYIIAGLSDDLLLEFGLAIKDFIPSEFSFHPLYPNPFNATATIRYGIPEDTQGSITIYNIRGSEVASLLNGNMNAGYHSINWNASTNSSGVYFVRIVAGSYIQTQKLMLLK